MKKQITAHLVSLVSGKNYIVQFDEINRLCGGIISLSGFVVDSNNESFPIGEEMYINFENSGSTNIVDERDFWTCDYEYNILFVEYFPNWFEKYILRRKAI